MPTWLAVLLAVFPVGASVVMAVLTFAYKNGVRARDTQLDAIQSDLANGFRRNDEAMSEQKRITAELRDRVGTQNGRVGKLEAKMERTEADIQQLQVTPARGTRRKAR